MEQARALLDNYPVVIDLPVTWGQMDAFGHVNNTVYFRYFEDARIAYFERVGLTAHKEAHGVGPILAETRCRFRLPLDFPDQIAVGARIARLDGDRFLMEYAVASRQHARLAAEGDGLIVCYDYRANTKAAVPAAIDAAIRELEGNALPA